MTSSEDQLLSLDNYLVFLFLTKIAFYGNFLEDLN